MSEMDLRKKLLDYLEEASPMIGVEDLKDDDDLEDAGMDSLDIVNFLLSIEENLGVKIADDELGDLKTLGQFIARINKDLK